MTTFAEQLEARWRSESHGEALTVLEENGSLYAQIEAATIEQLARIFVAGDDATRNAATDRLGKHWPWTDTVDREGDAQGEITHALVERAVEPQALLWPEGIAPTEVLEWVAEGLERQKEGKGANYREWCAGVNAVRVSWEKLAHKKPEREAETWPVFSRDTKVQGIDIDVDVGARVLHRHITGEQLAWLYWAAPTTRSVRSNLGRIASGDTQKRLITLIAPKAIEDEADKANNEAPGRLAEHLRRMVELIHDAWLVDCLSDVETAESLNKCLVSCLKAIGHRGVGLAKDVSKALRTRAPGDHWKLWQLELEGERFLVLLGRALWTDVVKREIEREAERSEPARLSTQFAKTSATARQHGGKGNGEQVLVEAPRGVSLCLPYVEGVQVYDGNRTGLVGLRQVLDGSAMRDYLAMTLQWLDSGAPPDGIFPAKDTDILEMIGATKHQERKNGRIYERYATNTRNALTKNQELFAAIRVRVVGDLEATAGDPLIDEIKDRRDRTRKWYAMSRLIAGHMLSDYIRVPREVCKLSPRDVPLAIGIATTVRGAIVSHSKGKPIEATVQTLADATGLDLDGLIRREGPSYLDSLAADAVRVGTEGRIGRVSVSGKGRDAIVTITPDDSLRASYQPLITASAKRTKATQIARVQDARKRRAGK